MVEITLANAGLFLIFAGVILAFVAIVLLTVRGRDANSQTRSAGILLIGPIPIVFGSDRESVRTIMVLAIILIVIVLAIMLIPALTLGR